MKEIVEITDDKGQVHVFDTFRGLIEYANTCGDMGWLPDGFTWRYREEAGFDVVRLKFEKEKNDLSDCLFNMYDVKNALSDEILKQPKDCDGTDISVGDCLDDAILFLETLNEEAH